MNPEVPNQSREELEARLTALLLGELPSDQAFALGRALEQDPELAKLYARLKETVSLVRETAVKPPEQTTVQVQPLKLSNNRREKLLAQFKTVKPREFSKPQRRATDWIPQMAAAAAVVLLLALLALPNVSKSRHAAQSSAIVNNLRQLDGAKQQWALDNNKSATAQPTMEDLSKYLRRELPSIAGEKYIPGRVGEPVSAELTSSQVKKFPQSGAVTVSAQNNQVSLAGEPELASSQVIASRESQAMNFGQPVQLREISSGVEKTPSTAKPGGIVLPTDTLSDYSGLNHGVVTASLSPSAPQSTPWPVSASVRGFSDSVPDSSLGSDFSVDSDVSRLLRPQTQPASSGTFSFLSAAPEPATTWELAKKEVQALAPAPVVSAASTPSVAFQVPPQAAATTGGTGGAGGGGAGPLLPAPAPAAPATPPSASPVDLEANTPAPNRGAEMSAFRRRFGLDGRLSGGAQLPDKRAAANPTGGTSTQSLAIADTFSSATAPAIDPTTDFPAAINGAVTLDPTTGLPVTTATPTLGDTPVLGKTLQSELSSGGRRGETNVYDLNVAGYSGTTTNAVAGTSYGGLALNYATEQKLESDLLKDKARMFDNAGTATLNGLVTLKGLADAPILETTPPAGREILRSPKDAEAKARSQIFLPQQPSASGFAWNDNAAKDTTLSSDVDRLGETQAWMDKAHQKQGNIGLADGTVQQFSRSRLQEALKNSGDTTTAQLQEREELARPKEGPAGTLRVAPTQDPGKPPVEHAAAPVEVVKEELNQRAYAEAKLNLQDVKQAIDDAIRKGLASSNVGFGGGVAYSEEQKRKLSEAEKKVRETELALRTDDSRRAPNLYSRTNRIFEGDNRASITNKLNKIRVDQFRTDGLPLSEVLKEVGDEAKKRDPEKRGIDFLVRSPQAQPVATDPTTGLPIVAGPLDVGAIVIKTNLTAGDFRLADVLDAIVKSAGKPIQYSIEDNGVVFSSVDGKKEIEDTAAQHLKPTAPIPQPEFQTRENAFSTFSMNVSDVSFKLAAASLEKGQMPDPASVRSEEFINAFDYRDPEPAAGVPIGFAWERARYPFAHNRDLLRFSVKTAAAGRQAGRPMNIVLLLDNSGSMERADRVQIIHEALRVLAGQLQPQDKLSVVTFARTARLWVDGIPGDQAGKVAEEVSGLTPQGGTNLEEAMNLAYQTAARHYLPNGINRVVLLTDGAANLGDVKPESLKQKVETQRKQGIALDCFGIGWEGYNDDLLEILSRNGDGRYGFLNTPEEAATDFAGQLAGALHVAASDLKVQVEFNPARVTAYRQIGYAKHQLTKEQFRDNTVDAAELGAAESGNALYVIEVNDGGEGPLATVRARYKVPGTSDYREHEWPVPYAGNPVALEQASPAMRLAATASAFSEWLVSSPYAADVTPDRLLSLLSGVPDVYGADARPKKLEWMIRQAKSVVGK